MDWDRSENAVSEPETNQFGFLVCFPRLLFWFPPADEYAGRSAVH